MKQSGGTIEVYSELGHGTTFKIYVPRVEEPADEPGAALPPVTDLSGSETILLVEDSEAVRKMAMRILESHGYTVLADPSETVRICQGHENPIHLLLTDVVLPEMDGRTLGERVKLLHPETAVLYMSGYLNLAIAQHEILDPPVSLLQKPFTPRALLQQVRQVLDRGRSGP
ncbi:MAG: response regulator [Gemmatimonadetes bacterium]|nr:response regulator [Gemmatimonadota bacterium]